MRRSADETPPAYDVIYTDAAEAEYDAIFTGFASRNLSAAERWLAQVNKAVEGRAAEHAALPGRRYIVDDAPLYAGHDVCYVRVGAWRVLYEIIDLDADGLTDTLRVTRFRPAAQSTSTSDEDE